MFDKTESHLPIPHGPLPLAVNVSAAGEAPTAGAWWTCVFGNFCWKGTWLKSCWWFQKSGLHVELSWWLVVYTVIYKVFTSQMVVGDFWTIHSIWRVWRLMDVQVMHSWHDGKVICILELELAKPKWPVIATSWYYSPRLCPSLPWFLLDVPCLVACLTTMYDLDNNLPNICIYPVWGKSKKTCRCSRCMEGSWRSWWFSDFQPAVFLHPKIWHRT